MNSEAEVTVFWSTFQTISQWSKKMELPHRKERQALKIVRECFSKEHPDKIIDHIRIFWDRRFDDV